MTSISDNGTYPSFCREAVQNEGTFRLFRSNQDYCGIVETVNYTDGKSYFNLALKKKPNYKKLLKGFSRNDTVGGPILQKYRYGLFNLKAVYFSPTTLRYINTLADLEIFFKSLDRFDIVEIGAGYGGLCRIISERFNFNSYTIVDLEPSLELAKKYLESFKMRNVQYVKPENIFRIEKRFDLVISNYAFSEVNREWQDLYFSRIIQNSYRGYMMCNFSTHTWDERQYTEQEVLMGVKNSVVVKNKPILSDGDIGNKISLIKWNIEANH